MSHDTLASSLREHLEAARRRPSLGRRPDSLVVADGHLGRDSVVRRQLAIADAVALATGLAVLAFVLPHAHPTRLFLWGLAVVPVWIVIFRAYGLYDRDVRRINHSTVDDIPPIFHALLVGSVMLWLYYRVLPSNGIVFAEVAVFGFAAGVAMLALRLVVRRVVCRLLANERVLLVGDGPEIELLARKLKSHPEYGADPVGFIAPSDRAARGTDLPLLGSFLSLDLPQVVRTHGIDRIVVAHGEVDEEAMLGVVRAGRELRVKVSMLPRLFDALGSSVEIDDVEGITLLGLPAPVLSRSSRLIKRATDILGSATLLLVTAPIQLAIMLAIKLDDGGPVLFRQQRVGRWNHRFEMLKYRTMDVDAEARREQLLAASTDPGWLLLPDDPRVTRIGRFLRRTSLDELPQAWNVLRGQMSLVGPRPLIEVEGGELTGWRRTRIDLKPGLTGLWQVLGRTSIPFDEMIKLDYMYVTNWSLWNDARLLLRTVPVVFGRRGAN